MTALAFPCPFCGLVASAAFAEGVAVLLHREPKCHEFASLEPDDYIAASRKLLQADVVATAPGGRS